MRHVYRLFLTYFYICHKRDLPRLVMLSVSQVSNWLEEYFLMRPGEIECPEGDAADRFGDFGLLIRLVDNESDCN